MLSATFSASSSSKVCHVTIQKAFNDHCETGQCPVDTILTATWAEKNVIREISGHSRSVRS